jgi:hypothetical protein
LFAGWNDLETELSSAPFNGTGNRGLIAILPSAKKGFVYLDNTGQLASLKAVRQMNRQYHRRTAV